jgi:FkbM family methyltransferase
MDDAYGLNRLANLSFIIDVGANSGIFALHAITRFPAGQVVCFEPYREIRQHLEKNCAGFNIIIREEAISGATGMAYLDVSTDPTASKISTVNSGGRPCPVLGLTPMLREYSRPVSLLKLDCEGSEYDAIEASSLPFVERVAIEFHENGERNAAYGKSLLLERGFTITRWRPFPGGRSGIVWAERAGPPPTE